MYASISRRFIALLLDGIFLSIIGGTLAYFLGGRDSLLYEGVIILGYFSYFEQSSFQGSFGKQIMGIKIVDNNGEPITMLRAILRNIVKLFCLGMILAFFNRENKTLHDYLASTLVLNKD